MDASKVSDIVGIMLERGELTEEHHRYLEERGLPDAATKGTFISADPHCLEMAFAGLKERGLVDDAVKLGVQMEERGSTTWNLVIAGGDLLVLHRDSDGTPRGLSPVGSGTMLPPGPCLFGLDRLASPSEYPIVCRSELTAVSLAEVGFDVVAVPGPLDGVRKSLDGLLEVLKKVRPTKVYVLVEGDRTPASNTSAGGGAADVRTADAQAFAVSVARRIEFAGLDTDVLDLGAVGLPQAVPEGFPAATLVETLVMDGIESSAPWATYLEKQSHGLRDAIVHALGEGMVIERGVLCILRRFPLEASYSRPAPGKAKGTLRLSLCGKDLPPDQVNILAGSGRTKWVADMVGKCPDLEPHVELLTTLVEELALYVAGGCKPAVTDPTTPQNDLGREVMVLGRRVRVRADGLWVYEPRGDSWRQFANFVLRILEERLLRQPGGEHERVYVGEASYLGMTLPFRIRTQDFEGSHLMEILGNQMGTGPTTSDVSLLRQTTHIESERPEVVEVVQDPGWHAGGVFLTKSGIIAPTVTEVPTNLRLDLTGFQEASHLDLLPESGPEEIKEVAGFVFGDFLTMGDPEAMPLLLGLGLAPILAGWLGDSSPFGVHICGVSGSAKSTCCRGFQCLHGPGYATASSLSWTSTANAIQAAGYGFRHHLVVIDDYRLAALRDPQGVQGLLQNLADQTSRRRLDRGCKPLQALPFRGHLLSNGEDPLDETASNAARVLPCQWNANPFPQELVERLRKLMPKFSSLTLRFVRRLQGLDRKSVRAEVDAHARKLREVFKDLPNGPRIAGSLATLWKAFELAVHEVAVPCGGLAPEGARLLLERYRDCEQKWSRELLGRVRSKEPASQFVDLLRQCIASSPGLLLQGNEPARERIGFLRGGCACLIWAKAMALVRDLAHKSGRDFSYDGDSVLRDLVRAGLVERGKDRRIKVQVSLNGQKLYVVRVPAKLLGFGPPQDKDPILPGFHVEECSNEEDDDGGDPDD